MKVTNFVVFLKLVNMKNDRQHANISLSTADQRWTTNQVKQMMHHLKERGKSL